MLQRKLVYSNGLDGPTGGMYVALLGAVRSIRTPFSQGNEVTKRVVLLTTIMMAALMVSGSASAFTLGVDYSETVQDYGLGTPGYDYVSTVDFYKGHGFIGWLQTESWEHSLSLAYTPVPEAYQIASARLDISGCRFFGVGGDLVEFAGSIQWTQVDGWRWIASSDNSFDLSSIDNSYWNAETFKVSMTPVFDLGVHVNQSVLSIDYVASGAFNQELAAVPEPASLLLVGVGLAGLVGLRVRRKA
jgi:hypothetical protein